MKNEFIPSNLRNERVTHHLILDVVVSQTIHVLIFFRERRLLLLDNVQNDSHQIKAIFGRAPAFPVL
jgi:hypothetical protein